MPLRDAFKKLAAKSDHLEFSTEFESAESFLTDVQGLSDGADPKTVVISVEGHSLTLPNEELAEYLRLGLALVDGEEIGKQKLITLPIPQDEKTADELQTILSTFDPSMAESRVVAQVDEIDLVVGTALGLTREEITFIQEDMRDDPFLSLVRPRYPFFTPKIRGRRSTLESTHRYR